MARKSSWIYCGALVGLTIGGWYAISHNESQPPTSLNQLPAAVTERETASSAVSEHGAALVANESVTANVEVLATTVGAAPDTVEASEPTAVADAEMQTSSQISAKNEPETPALPAIVESQPKAEPAVTEPFAVESVEAEPAKPSLEAIGVASATTDPASEVIANTDVSTPVNQPAATEPTVPAASPATTETSPTTQSVVAISDGDDSDEPMVTQVSPDESVSTTKQPAKEVPATNADNNGNWTAADAFHIHTDYEKAAREATEDRKMLFIYFHEPQDTASQRAFRAQTLADVEIHERLRRYVFLELPTDARIKIAGKSVTLLHHASFSEMLGRPGVAVIDLAHPGTEYYGYVVSTFPFTPGKYYRKEALSIILDLPPGTLTQRTMIYAVRIHPERPASTQGQFHHVLAEEAKLQSNYQAAILNQGHHSWDSRFHRISSRLPGGAMAQEVVAESWPNESLVEACIDCVHSWRQSPGHWGAVRSRHPWFGYDIKRGRNGIWYATGIFGLR